MDINIHLVEADENPPRLRISAYFHRRNGSSPLVQEISITLHGITLFHTTHVCYPNQTGTQHEILEFFTVSREMFDDVEKRRNREDMNLEVVVKEIVLGTDQIGKVPGKKHPFDQEQYNGSRMISAKIWGELSKKMGYPSYTVMEMPLVTIPPFEDFNRATDRLKEAAEKLFQGKNEESVLCCRKAFEAIEPLVTEGKGGSMKMLEQLAMEFDRPCRDPGNRKPKSERIEGIRKSERELMHIAAHEGYHVSRADAEFIYHSTLAMIRYYATCLNKMVENSI